MIGSEGCRAAIMASRHCGDPGDGEILIERRCQRLPGANRRSNSVRICVSKGNCGALIVRGRLRMREAGMNPATMFLNLSRQPRF